MQTPEDREFLLLIARHLQGFTDTLTDATQRRQMQGVVIAVKAWAKSVPDLGSPAGTDDAVAERASDHAPVPRIGAQDMTTAA